MLTPLQTKKLTRYFRLYDVDDDGRIDDPDAPGNRLFGTLD